MIKNKVVYVPSSTIFPCYSGNGCQWLGKQGIADFSKKPIAYCLKDQLIVGPEIGCSYYIEKKEK